METESNDSLSFLDVFIKKQDNVFLTSVHRKPTFSGLGSSYFSFCTKKFKFNSILTILNRVFNICSNYKFLHDEFQFLIFLIKIMVFLYNLSSLKLIVFYAPNTTISRTLKRTVKSYILVYYYLATNQKNSRKIY